MKHEFYCPAKCQQINWKSQKLCNKSKYEFREMKNHIEKPFSSLTLKYTSIKQIPAEPFKDPHSQT